MKQVVRSCSLVRCIVAVPALLSKELVDDRTTNLALRIAELERELSSLKAELASSGGPGAGALSKREGTLENSQWIALVEASGELLARPGSRDVVATVLDMAVRLLEADAYAVWRLQDEHGTWQVIASRGLSDSYERTATLKDGSHFEMPAAPFFIEDVESSELVRHRLPLYRAEGIRAILTVPLRMQAETAGSIVFYHRSARTFTESEVRISAALGNLAAAALGTADLYDRQTGLREVAQAAERRSRFLADAGAVLASSLDYEATLTRIADLAVPAIADWAMVDVLEAGEIKRVAVKHADADKLHAVQEAYRRYSPPDSAPSRVALRTGRSQLMPDIPDELLRSSISKQEHLEFARQLGLKSFITAPMVVHGTVLGLLTFVTAESGRRYSQTDLELAEELARRAAAAIENSRLYEQLKAGQKELSTILANIPDVISRFGPDLRYQFSSAAVETHTGLPSEQFTGKTNEDIGMPLDLCRRFDEKLRRIFDTGEPDSLEFSFDGPHGLRHYQASGVPEFAADGTVQSVLTITRDITEATAAAAELRAANEQLWRANADLNQFAYSASHDLQEPLRMVAIYSQLLSRRYAGKLDAVADEYIAYTVAGAHRMEVLVRDLLAYTQAIDKNEASDHVVDVRAILQGVLANLRAAIDASRAEVIFELLPHVRVHETHLIQLLQNLLSNAIKYRGPEAPRIVIAALRQNTEWLFSVRDNGAGIAPQYHEHIFGLFKRLHSSAEHPGTGIGLALCRKIVERYGGRIWVESELGRGSTFFFTLPG
jgi:PAS domain S-box-containing protein